MARRTKASLGEHEYAEEGGRRRRGLRWVLPVLLVLGLVAAALVFLSRKQIIPPIEQCQVTTQAGHLSMELEQGSNAATIAAVAYSRGLPERAVQIALATSLQESKLYNLEGGDRDSLGLFQQRPSMGWGTATQIADPVYATNRFLDALVKVPGYTRLPLTEAAQDVQKSGYPEAYAKHEGDAGVLSDALTGRAPGAFSCTVNDFATADPSASPTTPSVGSVQTLTDLVKHDFGRAVTASADDPESGTASPSPAANPVVTLTPQSSESTDSGSSSDAVKQSGWAVAQWAVAQARNLGIGTVSYDGKVWRVDQSSAGWKSQPGQDAVDSVRVTLGKPAKH